MTRHLFMLRTLSANTVRELVRSKLLYNLVIFAALLIGSSLFVAQLTIGQWDRVILDMGLAAIHLGGLLIAILIGVGLVAGEIERKTIFPTLAKPVSRGVFLLGRYLGLVLILAINVAVMLGALTIVLRMAGYGLSRTAVQAAALILVELMLLAAGALLFASFTTPVLASAFSLSLFLIGHLLSDLKAFAARSHDETTKVLVGAAYKLLPDLELLNVKAQAASGLVVEGSAVWSAALYGLAYAAGLLAVGMFIFQRRDLK